VYAYLVEATPQLEGETLRLRFDEEHRFHKESLETPKVKAYVEAALASVYGPSVGLSIELSAPTDSPAHPAQPSASDESPSAPSASADASRLEEATQLVQEILGGERLAD